ncbi:ABC transporter substrate-binding protein [Ferrimonas marina]|uniref:Cationic peptide transport system substrate-binding protein n=1 Tax=Ferrimonas marina TaxID=299255 RepID=A0A1M5Y9Y7_9GAMM|nr:ABC transporter substrate-binding protein [Ferrimonas marina]SHI08323.1 cationic peptide transport system substrate-binding protein [Ferrimonas marina]
MARIWLSVAALAWVLSGCSGEGVEPTSGMVYCSEGNPETFNPQLTTSSTAVDATAKQLYNRLLRIDPQTGSLVPELAINWQVSGDGRQYHFTLRNGVRFHQSDRFTPSREFNADDVLFSFNRIVDTTHPYHGVSGGRYPYFQSVGLEQNLARIHRLDDHQITFELHEPNASFLSDLATDFAVILSAEYGETLLHRGETEVMDQHPIGTGPFLLKDYRRNQYVRYSRHPHYWGEPAQIEQLVFDITPSSTTRVIKLIGGDCDVAALPQISELSVIQRYDDLAVDTRPGMNVAFWAFNTQKPPLDDPRVRRALSQAVDKRRLLTTVYHNTAVVGKGLLPPISWAYDPSLPDLNYDPERARQLLDSAGYSELELDIWAMPVGRIYNPNAVKTAELLQQDLAKIGVRANIVRNDWSGFIDKLQHAEYDSVLIGWSADNLDPDNFFSPLLSCAAMVFGSNRARWCDPNFDALIAEARASADPEQRRRLYQQLELMIQRQMPLMPLAHASRTLGRQRVWEGPILHTSGGIDFTQVRRAP